MLSTIALLLNFSLTAAEPAAPVNPTLIAYEKQQLQDRNRSEVRVVRAPVKVSPGLFTTYKKLDIPAAMVNRALDPANHVAEGFHFDPRNTHKIDMTVTEPFLINRGIKEVIGVGVSDFSGSIPNRRKNILRGMMDYDGKIIPQGAEFSFNSLLGEIDEDNGYAWAKTIMSGQDRWGLGGGICQVSTNIFRAALNAGLPISERRGHSYYLSKYSPAGLDATIYKEIQDLRFTNDTPGDVLMRVVSRDDKLVVLFFGTSDRTVALEKTSHWNGYDGRMATHWNRTVRKQGLLLAESFGSNYSGSYD